MCVFVSVSVLTVVVVNTGGIQQIETGSGSCDCTSYDYSGSTLSSYINCAGVPYTCDSSIPDTLSIGETIGIIIGVVVFFFLSAAAGAFLYYRYSHPSQLSPSPMTAPEESTESPLAVNNGHIGSNDGDAYRVSVASNFSTTQNNSGTGNNVDVPKDEV